MTNGILRATLLGIVASASFSLTQAASLAATSPDQMTKSTTCLTGPPNADAQAATPAGSLARILDHPEQTDRYLLLGGF